MKNSQYKEEQLPFKKTMVHVASHKDLRGLCGREKYMKEKSYTFEYQRSFMAIMGHSFFKKTLNTRWSERYFILTSTRLLYFADSSMTNFKGCFNLASLIQHRLKVRSKFPVISLIVWIGQEEESQKTLLQISIEDQQIFNEWLQQLVRVVHGLEKMKIEDRMLFPRIKIEQLLENNSKLGISNGNFWNSLHISQHQLLKYASHLDIILLRSKNPLFYVHRFFMRSYYDHVAILIKDESQKIYLFEAIQSMGVCLSSLQSILATFQDEYEEMGYRKLLIKDNTNFKVEQLEQYINSILGSKYELSFKKLLVQNQTIQNEETQEISHQNQPEYPTNRKTYFCSELVADIYLKFGILAEGKSNNYWPKDFQSNDMILSQQYSLSPIMKVQLQDPSDNSERSQL